jgi:Ser/Thr protein kinase RdoA (MazF antagonist)
MERDDREPSQALDAWALDDARCLEIEAGHINRTWRVDHARGRFALQWLNPIFAPEVHLDIEAVTRRLEQQGLTTPRLVPTQGGALWAVDADGGVWRLMTWIEGQMFLSADSAVRCVQAGRLLGAFHRALWEFEHAFVFGRLGVHDTARHLARLERSLTEGRRHRAFDRVAPVAQGILEAAEGLELDPSLPERMVHGDPKISNVLFSPDGAAICMVDLDTLARMSIALELGDALRSWCNPAGEDVAAPFQVDFFRAALSGYAASVGQLPEPVEREAIPAGVETIAVELAARFCTDALEESYFGWNRRRYPSASEHNLVRASSQLALARSIRSQRAELERITRKAFDWLVPE